LYIAHTLHPPAYAEPDRRRTPRSYDWSGDDLREWGALCSSTERARRPIRVCARGRRDPGTAH